jgi:hypothetical protein
LKIKASELTVGDQIQLTFRGGIEYLEVTEVIHGRQYVGVEMESSTVAPIRDVLPGNKEVIVAGVVRPYYSEHM